MYGYDMYGYKMYEYESDFGINAVEVCLMKTLFF
jgi:hypothetical protein